MLPQIQVAHLKSLSAEVAKADWKTRLDITYCYVMVQALALLVVGQHIHQAF